LVVFTVRCAVSLVAAGCGGVCSTAVLQAGLALPARLKLIAGMEAYSGFVSVEFQSEQCRDGGGERLVGPPVINVQHAPCFQVRYRAFNDPPNPVDSFVELFFPVGMAG
jgi:hypothetical protein